MTEPFYTSPEWYAVRDAVRERDGNRCSVARLLGGDCSGALHVHHLIPREQRPDLALDEDNCVTACAHHHPQVEMLARLMSALRGELPPCRHRHVYPSGRRECERRRLCERAERLERRAARTFA